MAQIVDRFEGEYAILLDGDAVLEVRRTDLAEGIAEGDVVFLGEDGIWQKDAVETKDRQERIAKKMNALWESGMKDGIAWLMPFFNFFQFCCFSNILFG